MVVVVVVVEVEVEVEVGVGLRLGFEVSEDEEAGQSGGEEYQNQSERTHFEKDKEMSTNCKWKWKWKWICVCYTEVFLLDFFEVKEMGQREKGEKGGWVQLKLSQIRLLIISYCLLHTHDFSPSLSLSISMPVIYYSLSFVLFLSFLFH